MDRKLAATIGATARAARTHAGLTQAEVAERLQIATEVYGRLERGTMLPSVETLVRLARCLSISTDHLLGFETEGEKQGLDQAGSKSLSPELRRLVRRVEQLDRRKQRVLSLLASEMGKLKGTKGAPPRGGGSSTDF